MNPDAQAPVPQPVLPEQPSVPPTPVPTPTVYAAPPVAAQPPAGVPLAPTQEAVQVNNPLSSMQEGERNIFEVRRHWFGIFGVYVSFGLLMVLVAVCAILAPSIFSDADVSKVRMFSLIGFLLVAVLSGLFVWVAHIVYYGNRWILTTDSITQVVQTGLFDKRSSQLSLGNLEDIAAIQDGILPHLFHYGTLKVETASETGRFMFPYCPNPNEYARKILAAREVFEQRIGKEPTN